jgi:hypothetical protein
MVILKKLHCSWVDICLMSPGVTHRVTIMNMIHYFPSVIFVRRISSKNFNIVMCCVSHATNNFMLFRGVVNIYSPSLLHLYNSPYHNLNLIQSSISIAVQLYFGKSWTSTLFSGDYLKTDFGGCWNFTRQMHSTIFIGWFRTQQRAPSPRVRFHVFYRGNALFHCFNNSLTRLFLGNGLLVFDLLLWELNNFHCSHCSAMNDI